MKNELAMKWKLAVLLAVFVVVSVFAQNPSGCFPAEKLPEYITPLTDCGQRSEFSHDGKTVYFVDEAGGEICKVDVATKVITQISKKEFLPEGHGYYRVYVLANGDLLFTCGPSRHNLYMQILQKGKTMPIKLNEQVDEGPAISRTDMKIVWTPDQKVIYSGVLDIAKNKASIKHKNLIIDNANVVVDGIKYDGILEPQNFRQPAEEEFTWTQYGKNSEGRFTSEVMGYNLKNGEITNYSKSPEMYSEPEGIFPDGDYTLMECDGHSLMGMKSIDLYKLKLDGTGKNYQRLTFFNDVKGYKASNPVVSDDGRWIAFQAANAKAAAGVGCGIYLFDVEKWEKSNKK